MIFYILYNISQDKNQVHSIILQNQQFAFDKTPSKTPFFNTLPDKPDVNKLTLSTQLEKVLLHDNRIVVLEKLIIDIETEMVVETALMII